MNMRATSKGMIFGTISTIILFIMKILAVGVVVGLSWWLVVLPLLLVIMGIAIYVAMYAGKIFYKRKKYKRQQESSRRK